jgi:spore germination cell wall hydrolase CwlJ-like protein
MYRRRFYRAPSIRLASTLSGWWREARFRWYTSDKGPWIAGSIMALVIAGFGFLLASVSANRDERRELMCLARNVYFEARGETPLGQYAVAEVTMNRVASGRYPDTVCGVVYQQNWDVLRKRYVGAFSWTELERNATPQGAAWEHAWKVAEDVYYRRREPALDGALWYHAEHIRPSWSRERKPVARIGRHIFYR